MFSAWLAAPNGYGQLTEADLSAAKGSHKEQVELLVSTNWESRLRTVEELDAERKELVRGLLSILDGTNSDHVKVNAVIVLGEYRAVEAVPVLVDHLDWDGAAHGGFFNARVAKEEVELKTAPVSSALIKIGTPAVPRLLAKIAETDDTNTVMKCLSICQSIEGRDLVRFRLQALLSKEDGEQRKQRFQAALATLENLKSEQK